MILCTNIQAALHIPAKRAAFPTTNRLTQEAENNKKQNYGTKCKISKCFFWDNAREKG
jgi:hypothetical protein